MNHQLLHATNSGRKNPMAHDVPSAIERELARLFDRFRGDMEKLFGTGRPKTANRPSPRSHVKKSGQ